MLPSGDQTNRFLQALILSRQSLIAISSITCYLVLSGNTAHKGPSDEAMGEGFWNGSLERRSPVADKAQSVQFLNDSLQHNRFTPPPETRDTSYTKRQSSLDKTQAKLIDTLRLGRTDVVRRFRCTDGGYVLPVISLRPAPHAHDQLCGVLGVQPRIAPAPRRGAGTGWLSAQCAKR